MRNINLDNDLNVRETWPKRALCTLHRDMYIIITDIIALVLSHSPHSYFFYCFLTVMRHRICLCGLHCIALDNFADNADICIISPGPLQRIGTSHLASSAMTPCWRWNRGRAAASSSSQPGTSYLVIQYIYTGSGYATWYLDVSQHIISIHFLFILCDDINDKISASTVNYLTN